MTDILSEINLSGRRRLPMIHAAEGAECGLACLAMVARYQGHDIDLNGLRQRFSLSMTGATLRTLIGIADSMGLASRALRVELEDLGQVRTPAILHWDLNHFVVLKAVRNGKAVIHDPARGLRAYALAEVSNHFSGIVLELTSAETFERITARMPVKLTSLWSRITGFRSTFLQVLGLSLALQVVVFVLPFQLQLVIDEGVLRADQGLLTVLAIGFGALFVVQSIIEALRGWTLQVFGQLLSFQVIGNIVRHLMRLPSDYFEKRHVGDIISRIGSASAIQDILTRGLIATVIDGVMAVVAVIIMAIYSPVLTLVVVAAVILNLLVATVVSPALRARMEEQLVETAREQSHIMETVRAATVIKIMGRESEREGTWRNLFAAAMNARVSVGKYRLTLAFGQNLITGLQTVLVVYLGARTIIAGDGFSIGMLFAFLSFRQTFTDRANALVSQVVEFRSVGLHLERLSDVITAEAETSDRGGSLAELQVSGAISLRGVSFRYGAGDPVVLKGVNLDVAAGEFIAITGVSGGGKTTLMKILLGLRVPTEGRILLDGCSPTAEVWRAWRERIGVVSQDDRLLSGTIADNIAFFDPDLDMGRVQAAAAASRIHDDIMKMPMAYLSLVGDMGSTLSGGQRQRVLLARALYRKPAILFLDEGTANLDEETEKEIVDLVESFSITRIVVAHRPALLSRAQRVLALQDGVLVRQGQTSPATVGVLD